MSQDLKALIREITKEVIDEMTATGAVAGYNTPNAFGKNPSKKEDTAKSMPGGKVVGDIDTDDTTVGEGERLTLRRNLEENKKTDRTGMKCEKCGKGTYQEESIHDDIDGVLHCTECGISVTRYAAAINEGRSRYRNFKESDEMRNHAKISFGIREAKRILREVEFLVSICERLQTEEKIGNGQLWARTKPDILAINRQLKEISKRVYRIGKRK